MGLRGIELQVMVPRLEDVSQVQRRGDEGSAQERFAAQLTQEVEERRQEVQETEKSGQGRVDNSEPRQRRGRQPGPHQEKRRKNSVAPPVPGERGRRLDVRT